MIEATCPIIVKLTRGRNPEGSATGPLLGDPAVRPTLNPPKVGEADEALHGQGEGHLVEACAAVMGTRANNAGRPASPAPSVTERGLRTRNSLPTQSLVMLRR